MSLTLSRLLGCLVQRINSVPPIKFSRSVLTLLRALAVLSVPDVKEFKQAAVKDGVLWLLTATEVFPP